MFLICGFLVIEKFMLVKIVISFFVIWLMGWMLFWWVGWFGSVILSYFDVRCLFSVVLVRVIFFVVSVLLILFFRVFNWGFMIWCFLGVILFSLCIFRLILFFLLMVWICSFFSVDLLLVVLIRLRYLFFKLFIFGFWNLFFGWIVWGV